MGGSTPPFPIEPARRLAKARLPAVLDYSTAKTNLPIDGIKNLSTITLAVTEPPPKHYDFKTRLAGGFG